MTTPNYTNHHKCIHCDCTFTRKYSLERHMVRKHKENTSEINGEITQNSGNLAQNCSNVAQNCSNVAQKCGNPAQNCGNLAQKCGNLEIEEEEDDYGFETELTHCPTCKKEFTKHWNLLRHIKTCRYKNDENICHYCNKSFKHRSSKYKHYKICKYKNGQCKYIHDDDKKETPTASTIEQHVQNASVINNQNTIENQTNIDTQNNNTQNIIIVYNPENMEFVTDKINYDIIQNLLQSKSCNANSHIVKEYGKEIFSIPENQCIKKNDLKSGHSEVHLGDDKWEKQLDRHIYPKLACSVANNMSDYLNSKKDIIRNDIFNKTIKFLDYMSDEGYINTDDKEKEKQIKREYKDLIKELRLVIHSKTDVPKKQKSSK
jgi:hypothetical protein